MLGHCLLKFLGMRYNTKIGDKHTILFHIPKTSALIIESNIGPDLTRTALMDSLIPLLALYPPLVVDDVNKLNLFGDQWNVRSSNHLVLVKFR